MANSRTVRISLITSMVPAAECSPIFRCRFWSSFMKSMMKYWATEIMGSGMNMRAKSLGFNVYTEYMFERMMQRLWIILIGRSKTLPASCSASLFNLSCRMPDGKMSKKAVSWRTMQRMTSERTLTRNWLVTLRVKAQELKWAKMIKTNLIWFLIESHLRSSIDMVPASTPSRTVDMECQRAAPVRESKTISRMLKLYKGRRGTSMGTSRRSPFRCSRPVLLWHSLASLTTPLGAMFLPNRFVIFLS
mmetsp:Transcript_1903/g.5777  ORF Transcript_1903/g.5777 Transcript_1903/m.5777 type:complete len:247 (+) Transcript_1903:1447-2187(+)